MALQEINERAKTEEMRRRFTEFARDYLPEDQATEMLDYIRTQNAHPNYWMNSFIRYISHCLPEDQASNIIKLMGNKTLTEALQTHKMLKDAF